jgi:glycosyltransferase involved in cell wall biosynthesis
MKVICITNLFPDVTRPSFAPFNRQQLVRLAASHELRLIVPVPWPRRSVLALRGMAPEPTDDCRGVMRIDYPVSYYTPKVMRRWYGAFYERSIRGLFERRVREERPDVVYATWAYPDCYAASILAGRRGLPLVARVHGSDINRYFAHRERKRRILEALARARAVVSVSKALRDLLSAEGLDAERIHVIYNGIDRGLFKPLDRAEARRGLGLDPAARIVLFAGNLEPVKGLDRLVEAFGAMEGARCELHIIGDGPERARLEALARRLPAGRVARFQGRVEHGRMGEWLNACDVFALPSLAEGTPNVVLEALACRTPVVASDTGGIPEVVPAGAGILVPPGDARALARALGEALERPWDRNRIECPAGSWEDSARLLGEVLERAAREGVAAGARR